MHIHNSCVSTLISTCCVCFNSTGCPCTIKIRNGESLKTMLHVHVHTHNVHDIHVPCFWPLIYSCMCTCTTGTQDLFTSTHRCTFCTIRLRILILHNTSYIHSTGHQVDHDSHFNKRLSNRPRTYMHMYIAHYIAKVVVEKKKKEKKFRPIKPHPQSTN